MIKVLVVDDYPTTREGLISQINGRKDMTVTGQAGTIHDALKLVDVEIPDVLILDLEFPDGSGIDLLEQLLSMYPGIRVLVLSMHPAEVYEPLLLCKGAMAYLNKSEDIATILETVRIVAQGRKVTVMIENTQTNLSRNYTPMQKIVTEKLCQGYKSKDIAKEHDICEAMVNQHKKNAMRKARVTDLVGLCAYWRLTRGN